MTGLPWVVIRQDEHGNRYRVGRYASRDEAQEVADALGASSPQRLYLIEHLDHRAS